MYLLFYDVDIINHCTWTDEQYNLTLTGTIKTLDEMFTISSPFYACAKQMFTSVFTNKYSDTSFSIASFSRFRFI